MIRKIVIFILLSSIVLSPLAYLLLLQWRGVELEIINT